MNSCYGREIKSGEREREKSGKNNEIITFASSTEKKEEPFKSSEKIARGRKSTQKDFLSQESANSGI